MCSSVFEALFISLVNVDSFMNYLRVIYCMYGSHSYQFVCDIFVSVCSAVFFLLFILSP